MVSFNSLFILRNTPCFDSYWLHKCPLPAGAPGSGGNKPLLPVKFVSHCFFLTHKCLILGLTQTIHLYKHIQHIISRVSIIISNIIIICNCNPLERQL